MIVLSNFKFYRKNGSANVTATRTDSEHNLQEYTYKKITPCDVCSQVLRGELAFKWFPIVVKLNHDFLVQILFNEKSNSLSIQ